MLLVKSSIVHCKNGYMAELCGPLLRWDHGEHINSQAVNYYTPKTKKTATYLRNQQTNVDICLTSPRSFKKTD